MGPLMTAELSRQHQLDLLREAAREQLATEATAHDAEVPEASDHANLLITLWNKLSAATDQRRALLDSQAT